MSKTWLHRVLEWPWVYRSSQAILSAGGSRIDQVYDELWRDVRGIVLDVGSGPTPDTPLPDGVMIGLDVNLKYIRRYATQQGSAETRGVVASATAIPFAGGTFDECRSAALLHHLPDDGVRSTVREMYRTVRPGGRLAIFDMVLPRSFAASPLGWLLCRFDRGAWVRPAAELRRLVEEACAAEWESRTFAYSWAGLRGIVLLAHRRRES